MNLMLLCAGTGSRLQPFTNLQPKPCIPFLGAPLASYSLALAQSLSIDNLVVNTHHLPNQVEDLFRQIPHGAKSLHFSFEKELLGSGGGIHNAKKYLQGGDDFLVMNGDEVILPEQNDLLEKMLKFHQQQKSLATLLVMDHPEVGKKFGGAWSNPEGQVSQFSKTTVTGLKGHHFIGAMILSPKIFSYFKNTIVDENILYETLTLAMTKNEKVFVYPCKAQWYETGNPTDFIAGSNFYVDQLLKNRSDNHWKKHLLQVIRKFGTQTFLIEKDHPDLTVKLKQLWNSI